MELLLLYTVVWENSPLDIFIWNMFIVKYFRPLESPMNKNITFYSLLKIFRAFNFRRVTPATKIFNVEFFPNYGIAIFINGITIILNNCLFSCVYSNNFVHFLFEQIGNCILGLTSSLLPEPPLHNKIFITTVEFKGLSSAAYGIGVSCF